MLLSIKDKPPRSAVFPRLQQDVLTQKILLQSASRALQSAAAWEVYYKERQGYYRVRQLIFITKCRKFITQCDSHYKVRQKSLQSAAVITKCGIYYIMRQHTREPRVSRVQRGNVSPFHITHIEYELFSCFGGELWHKQEKIDFRQL